MIAAGELLSEFTNVAIAWKQQIEYYRFYVASIKRLISNSSRRIARKAGNLNL